MRGNRVPAGMRRADRLAADSLAAEVASLKRQLEDTRAKSAGFGWKDLPGLVTSLTAIGALIFTALSLQATRSQIQDQQQTQLSEQGQITGRYTAAVEQLGSDTLDQRLGGVYALERISHDSPRDRNTILDVLAAFVRDHTPRAHPDPTPASLPDYSTTFDATGVLPFDRSRSISALPNDVQAAMAVISRTDRGGTADSPPARVDLSGCDLHGAVLDRLDLSGVNLTGVDLRGSTLSDVDLQNTSLVGADLSGSVLTDSDLSHADLVNADLRNSVLGGTADLSGASLYAARLDNTLTVDANLKGADLDHASLRGALLRDADLRTANLTHADFTDADLDGANFTGANIKGAVFNEAGPGPVKALATPSAAASSTAAP